MKNLSKADFDFIMLCKREWEGGSEQFWHKIEQWYLKEYSMTTMDWRDLYQLIFYIWFTVWQNRGSRENELLTVISKPYHFMSMCGFGRWKDRDGPYNCEQWSKEMIDSFISYVRLTDMQYLLVEE